MAAEMRDIVREQGIAGTCAALAANILLRGSSALMSSHRRHGADGLRGRALVAAANLADRTAGALCDAFDPGEGSSDFYAGTPGYDEPIDSESIDPDPDFREVLRLLNAAGAHTVSSCQGHAPGTQYEDVQGWMAPYITCWAGSQEGTERARGLLQTAGENEWAETSRHSTDGRVLAKFPIGWEWRRSVAFLRARI